MAQSDLKGSTERKPAQSDLLENRYTNGQAAERLGVTKNTLYRWEVRKKAGDPRYADFPAPPRIVHSNHRFYTDTYIERIREWKNRTSESAA